MRVGICKIRIRIPHSNSLKTKRSTVKSIISRTQGTFNVSISEVEDYDLWQLSTLGISCVSNHSQHTEDVLSKVINFVMHNYPEVEIIEKDIEILNGF